jgi:hypothetical protein
VSQKRIRAEACDDDDDAADDDMRQEFRADFMFCFRFCDILQG